MEKPLENMYQQVTLVLKDGSKHYFTGKAFCDGVIGECIVIEDVIISPPKALPDDCSFDTMN